MTFLRINENNDWSYGKNEDLVIGDLEILFDVKTTIQSWINDCWFAMDKGLDWWAFLSDVNQEQALTLALEQAALSVRGVTNIISTSLKKDEGRNVVASIVFKTIYNTELQVNTST